VAANDGLVGANEKNIRPTPAQMPPFALKISIERRWSPASYCRFCAWGLQKKYFCAAFLYLDNTKSGSEM